ncbi:MULTISPECIES: sporulation protein YunB [Bacillus]|uniref:Sporulation protein YunB n=1 Tax=Bacillus glycinifermentans TaxID=1664069 RepID=A0AAJ3Z0K2_9BACI|nr:MULTISPECIES: sporulation protein YunB [Bacillus]KKB72940.1 sporulation protein [Bacillus sp. TH008]MBU8785379.1 sporulation protein YunB [Bacillus glycinifermentans]MDU0072971.1 sporulation protein YunB [Bacillus sp. IG6]MED8020730.1 sporulation protein YunB [Bacillus glycinifermentans]NUJ15703.1 sporulation protein YunB [Bacillus glycinifermentans]
MRRFRGPLSKRGPLPFRYVMLLSFVIFIFSTTVSLLIINSSIKPTLLNIAEMETNRIAMHAIQEAVESYISKDKNVQNMIEMKTSENGKVTTVDFNSHVVKDMQSKITKALHHNLQETETEEFNSSAKTKKGRDDGVIYQIPLGQTTGNSLLGNLGPKIPVRLNIVGDVFTDVKESVKPYGINNALINIGVLVEVKVRVVIPFATKTAVVKNTIPATIQAIHGDVPDFYSGSGSQTSPSIQIPSKGEKADEKE